jgi:pimeloyl-ACP methyl ester carboxylesterase
VPFARNGDVRLHWHAEGQGEPVLMIMGLNGSSQAWWRLLPHVAASHQAIVFDNRGTGASDPVRGPLSMTDMVEDALAVLDAAGHASAHVIGASMGGMVAQHIALEHRARVRSLLLTCTSPMGRGGQPPWRLVASAALRPLVGLERLGAVMAPTLYSRRTREHNRARMEEDLRHRLSNETPSRTVYAQLAAILRHDTRRRLHELATVPTTVLHGREDVLVPPERGVALAHAIPGSRLILLDDCGHIMTTDCEAEVVAVVREHLAWVAGGEPAEPDAGAVAAA